MKLPSTLLLALLLSGCSWLQVDNPPGGGTGGSNGGGVGVAPPPVNVEPPIIGGGAGGAAREVADPTVVDAHPAAIDHFEIGADGRTVVIYWWGGNQACFGLSGVLTELVDGAVSFTVMEGTRGAAVGMACTMEALLKSTVVELDSPLLVDGSGQQQFAGEPTLATEPLVVQPVAGAIDPRPVAIGAYALTPDGLTLTIHFTGGLAQCYATAPADVDADAGVLTITVREGRQPGGPDACDDIGVAKALVVILSSPLLVDGAAR